jgi:hypothetical protein
MHTPLVDWLRAQDDAALVTLLARRPDLAVPPPTDLTVLATRAAVRSSVLRSCDDLDTVSLAVLEALVVADADLGPVPLAQLRHLLGPDVEARVVGAALARLRERALAWGDDDAIIVGPAVRDAVPRFPGGLGRPASGLAASSALPGLLDGVDDEERRILHTLAAGPPIGRSRSDPAGPVGRLVGKGLLLRVDAETVELPRQVGLALRGDRPLGALAVTPPDVRACDRGVETVDATAVDAALRLLRQVENLIGHWGRTPPAALRSGGLGVRELRRAAKEIEADETVAALVVELVVAADLAAASEGPAPQWVPTTAADGWLAVGPELRWALLARTWLDLPRLPGLVGRRDDAGRPVPVLSDAVRRPQAARDRRRVLDGLAELAAGTAVGSVSALADVLAWRAPRRGGRLRDEVVTWTLAEATTLGVVALDALSTPGRTLLEDPDRTAAALRAALPEPVEHILLQADLTAVAPGRLGPELARELDLCADIESAGGATVYRFTDSSVRRFLDAGRDAADLHALLARRSATPVPQALTYLIDDVARRYGRLRGGVAGSFLRSDDEVLLTEVLAHPEAGLLELRRIAPTVLVSPLPLAEVLAGLRAAGFSPAADHAESDLGDLGDRGEHGEHGEHGERGERGRRIEPRSRPGLRSTGEPSRAQLAAVVARLRSGDALAEIRRSVGAPVPGNGSAVDALRVAAVARRTVWIGYVDAHGTLGELLLQPLRIGGGVVEGRDGVDGGLHRVPLHRITSIAPVDD